MTDEDFTHEKECDDQPKEALCICDAVRLEKQEAYEDARLEDFLYETP